MKASFAEFYVLWDEYLGRETPLFHIETCEWMENLSDEVDNLLMLPRGHNKSGIVTVFNAWRFYRDVDDLVLHQGATNIDALKCSRAVVRILANHPLCKLNNVKKSHGGVIKWWVEGSNDEQYGSMYARGILSSVTGQRAKHIQNDDVEVQKNVATEENREKLKHSLTEQTHILVPGGTSLFIGTPHSYESIYKEMIEAGANCFIRRMFEHEYRIEGRREAVLSFYPEYVFSGIHKYSKCLEEDKHYTIEKHGNGYKVTL
ncbi:TPA: phage terminase large subunit, partial [Acinetobacter baumannii]|nr:phage terminase large subunit [Acinetobacter baumannii]